MRASCGLKAVTLAGVTLTMVACSVQSNAFSQTISPNYRGETKRLVSRQLLYASAIAGSDVLVFSYPQGGLVQTLTGFVGAPYFMCSDQAGDVFVPTTDFKSPGYIYEFAHGGSAPIETLIDPGPGFAQSCSVDPTTGNLAVANGEAVAVYPQARGTPTVYEASDVGASDCAYDDSGDLFVDGHTYQNKIAEVPAGGSVFSDIVLSTAAVYTLHLQWHNKRLVMYGGYVAHGPYQLFQIRIVGSRGIVSNPVLLYGKSKHRAGSVGFVVTGKTIVMPRPRPLFAQPLAFS